MHLAYFAITWKKLCLALCLISHMTKAENQTLGFFQVFRTASAPVGSVAASAEGPESDHCGQDEKCFLGRQGPREWWNLLAGLVMRCFPKKVGQSCNPHKGWYSLPQGEDCFIQVLHPYWQRNRTYWHREGPVGGQLSLGPVWLKRLEALAEVCEAKNGVRTWIIFCFRTE